MHKEKPGEKYFSKLCNAQTSIEGYSQVLENVESWEVSLKTGAGGGCILIYLKKNSSSVKKRLNE